MTTVAAAAAATAGLRAQTCSAVDDSFCLQPTQMLVCLCEEQLLTLLHLLFPACLVLECLGDIQSSGCAEASICLWVWDAESIDGGWCGLLSQTSEVDGSTDGPGRHLESQIALVIVDKLEERSRGMIAWSIAMQVQTSVPSWSVCVAEGELLEDGCGLAACKDVACGLCPLLAGCPCRCCELSGGRCPLCLCDDLLCLSLCFPGLCYCRGDALVVEEGCDEVAEEVVPVGRCPGQLAEGVSLHLWAQLTVAM